MIEIIFFFFEYKVKYLVISIEYLGFFVVIFMWDYLLVVLFLGFILKCVFLYCVERELE